MCRVGVYAVLGALHFIDLLWLLVCSSLGGWKLTAQPFGCREANPQCCLVVLPFREKSPSLGVVRIVALRGKAPAVVAHLEIWCRNCMSPEIVTEKLNLLRLSVFSKPA